MYQHILVPTDGSPLADEMIKRAVQFARSIGAWITFLYVIPDESADFFGNAALIRSISPAQFVERHTLQPDEILSRAASCAFDSNVACEKVIEQGVATYQAILRNAISKNCDLIFMASHGRKSKIGMMIDSETLKVLMASKVPVLVSSMSDLA